MTPQQAQYMRQMQYMQFMQVSMLLQSAWQSTKTHFTPNPPTPAKGNQCGGHTQTGNDMTRVKHGARLSRRLEFASESAALRQVQIVPALSLSLPDLRMKLNNSIKILESVE